MEILNSALITQSLTVQNLQENLRRSQRAYLKGIAMQCGILVGKVVRTLQNSHSSCQNADEGRSQHELPKTDSLNGAISLVNESKENGLKLDDSPCQVEPVKPSEMFFSKTNGLLET